MALSGTCLIKLTNDLLQFVSESTGMIDPGKHLVMGSYEIIDLAKILVVGSREIIYLLNSLRDCGIQPDHGSVFGIYAHVWHQ